MIDVHTHVPTHRDVVPPAELIENADWRPDRVVKATTTWAEYARAFAEVELSVAFTIARDRTRLQSELNDNVAAFVADAPSRRIGFLSVHPLVERASDELERAHFDLGLKGVKLGPNYQVFDPLDPAALRIYELAERLGLPILFHQGASPVREAPLRYAHPLVMDEVAIRFPELRIVMAHLGHPWQRETIVTIRKHPHVYADVSALFYRPWSLYEGLRVATEWGVLDKLLFGSDFPIATPTETVAGLLAVNTPIVGTSLPPIPLDAIEEIIRRDPLPLLGLDRPS
ncbi:MAG: amidohydrolase family protein [Myxococcales bacterium]|nr:amidohydrolase family protein [Myxococcales bacterium]